MSVMAVFGGSFDPVHNAHLAIAQKAVDEMGADVIIFVPAYIPPHKKSLVADSKHRLNMLSLALEKRTEYLIDTFEIDRKSSVYSFQTLDYINKKYSGNSIKLLIGSDSFNMLETWEKPEYVAKKYGFFVMQRPDNIANINSRYYKYGIFSKTLIEDISSTRIRLYMEENISAAHLMPESVWRYIKENKLYGK